MGPEAVKAAFGVETQDVVERHPDAGEAAGQIEHVAEFAIPAGQAQIGVEHRNALAGEIQRRLQHVAVVEQSRRGVVDQSQRRGAGDIAPPQQQRQHEARGGGAYRRGEHVFGDAQKVDVGFRPRIVIFRPRPAKKVSKASWVRGAPR